MDPSTFPGKGFFEVVYQGDVPWDIGAAQPALMELIDEYPPVGRVLDLGCGTGDLVIALAERGIEAVGVDFVEAAIDVARARVSASPEAVRSRVHLEVGDALRPSLWKGRIASVVDSGFLHLFDATARHDLVEDLADALPAGGRYYLLGFAVSFPVPNVPTEVTETEVRRLFAKSKGWKVLALRPAEFRTKGFESVPALAACVERTT